MRVLCNLDNYSRISIRNKVFLLEIKNSGKWEKAYEYTWIGDAIKGYVLCTLSRIGSTTGCDIYHLMKSIDSLKTSVDSVDKKLCEVIKIMKTDPVESVIMGDNNE